MAGACAGPLTFTRSNLRLRDPIPILDNHRRCIVSLLGCPSGAGWKRDVHDQIFEAMKAAAGRCTFTDKQRDHRRGTYRCLGIGISFGGGQQRPGNLRNGSRNTAQLDGLLNLACFKRLAGFIDREQPFSTPLAGLTPHSYYRWISELPTETSCTLQHRSDSSPPK